MTRGLCPLDPYQRDTSLWNPHIRNIENMQQSRSNLLRLCFLTFSFIMSLSPFNKRVAQSAR